VALSSAISNGGAAVHGLGISAVFSRLAFLAMVGFLAMLLVGPAIAVVAVVVSVAFAILLVLVGLFLGLLPLIAVGFLVCLPFYIFNHNQHYCWRLGSLTRRLSQAFVVMPFQTFGMVMRGAARRCEAACERTRELGWAVAGISLETVSGAVILGSLAALLHTINPEHRLLGQAGIGAAIGAFVGFLVGVGNYWPARSDQPADHG
jgi:hypothetical protein